MAKQLIFNEDARKKMLSGVEQIASAVKVTLLVDVLLCWTRNLAHQLLQKTV